MLTLQEEILVVLDYTDLTHATHIIQKIFFLRASSKDSRTVDPEELSRTLYLMFETEDLLEPWTNLLTSWKKKKIRAVRIAELKGLDPLGREPLELCYRLTPKGWKWQRAVIEKLTRDNDWIQVHFPL